MREPVIVFANCQGAILAWIFNHAPTVAARYDFQYHLNFPDRPAMSAAIPMATRAACPIFVHQIGAWGHDCDAFQGLPTGCEIVHIPAPFTSSLYPLRRFFPERPPIVPRRFELFWELGDKLAIQLVEQGLSKPDYLVQYFATDIRTSINCERLHELDLARSRQQDALCDVKITDYIEENFRKQQLYHTLAHLSDPFYFHFAQAMLDAFANRGIPLFAEHHAQIRAEIEAFQDSGVTLHSEVQIPIHAQVAEMMQLAWYDPARIYRNRDYDDWTFPEFIDFLYDYVRGRVRPLPWTRRPLLDGQSRTVSQGHRAL